MARPIKTPSDSLPYGFRFASWMAKNALDDVTLVSDTLLTATISATPSGLVIGATVIDGTIARATISGGTVNTDYLLSCLVTTAAGLIAVAEEVLQVRTDAR